MTEARWLIRSAAVLAGLANLLVLAHYFGSSPALPTGVIWKDVSLRSAMPNVIVAVLAGLAASEVAIGRFDKLSAFGRYVFFEKLLHPRAGIVGTVCLGGALMGVGISCLFVLQSSPVDTETFTLLEHTAVAMLQMLGTSVFGVSFGAVLGAAEGLLLAPPLTAVLARFDGRAPLSRTAA